MAFRLATIRDYEFDAFIAQLRDKMSNGWSIGAAANALGTTQQSLVRWRSVHKKYLADIEAISDSDLDLDSQDVSAILNRIQAIKDKHGWTERHRIVAETMAIGRGEATGATLQRLFEMGKSDWRAGVAWLNMVGYAPDHATMGDGPADAQQAASLWTLDSDAIAETIASVAAGLAAEITENSAVGA